MNWKKRSTANHSAKKTAALPMTWKQKPQHCQSLGENTAALPIILQIKPQHSQ